MSVTRNMRTRRKRKLQPSKLTIKIKKYNIHILKTKNIIIKYRHIAILKMLLLNIFDFEFSLHSDSHGERNKKPSAKCSSSTHETDKASRLKFIWKRYELKNLSIKFTVTFICLENFLRNRKTYFEIHCLEVRVVFFQYRCCWLDFSPPVVGWPSHNSLLSFVFQSSIKQLHVEIFKIQIRRNL